MIQAAPTPGYPKKSQTDTQKENDEYYIWVLFQNISNLI
jgi:hypothetical protein